jgi:hypothetical protein
MQDHAAIAAELQQLPDEVRQVMAGPMLQQQTDLIALGQDLDGKLADAIKARKESGIEATWLQCEESYLGIDDENRHEFQGAKWMKPMTMDGVLTRRQSSNDVRATAFLQETGRYVDAGWSKVCEIALPIDGKPFTLKPTPVPELTLAMDDERPAETVTGQPMPGPDGQPVKVSDLAKHMFSKAEKAAERSAARIYDWLVECKHNAEVRKATFDMARIGVAVMKGPVPQSSRAMVVTRTETGGVALEFVNKVKPGSEWVDAWNFYPAPGCGEDVRKAPHVFERLPRLASQLKELAQDEAAGYIRKSIEEALREGPTRKSQDSGNTLNPMSKEQFECFLFYGLVPARFFRAANPKQAAEEWGDDTSQDPLAPEVPVLAEICNGRVIRMVMAVLESGRHPYHTASWSRRPGSWAGKGVAEQCWTPQRMLNAAVRRLLSNAGLSSGSQVVMDPNAVEPAVAGDYRILADKLWFLRKDSGIDDVRKVFAAFQWPNNIDGLLKLIEFTLRMFEEHTSIPLITQGQSGDTTPDTFGGQQLQDNNANQLLRSVGFTLNDGITSPMIDQFYEWLLLDPDVPNEEKGDYKVDTSGALAIIEKALQDQSIMAMAQMIQNPAFRIDPAKWFAEWAKSKRLVPETFQYTEADWEEIQKRPPPLPPAVMAAQVRAQSAEKIAQSRDQLAAQRNENDLDRDTRYNEVLAAREEANAAARLEELRLKHDLAMLEFMKDERKTLQETKTRLADTTMKLRAQMTLAGQDGKGPQVATPPNEPPGRAPEGEAYQK